MTQATKKRVQVQMDSSLADEGNAILDRLGMTQSSAITMFYTRLVAKGGLPFSTELTEREKNELAIQQLTADLPVTELDTPEKIKEWADKDD